jgi:hypothetical protein
MAVTADKLDSIRVFFQIIRADTRENVVLDTWTRAWRLALLLGLPLCGGLVLSLATALMARR